MRVIEEVWHGRLLVDLTDISQLLYERFIHLHWGENSMIFANDDY